jgi:hypothetical protein
MELRIVEREAQAFQRSLGAGEIEAVCRRAFGGGVVPVVAVELGVRGVQQRVSGGTGWARRAGGTAGGA